MRVAAAVYVLIFPNQVFQTHVHGPVTGGKKNTSCHTVLTVLAVKTQISHKKKVEGELVRSGLLQLQLVWSLWGIVTVRWNPDWIFSITTALSKAAKAKTPWQPAGSPSKLFVRESVMRNISTKRALTYFVSEANWTIYMQRLVEQVAGSTARTTRSKTFLSICNTSAWVVLHRHWPSEDTDSSVVFFILDSYQTECWHFKRIDWKG